MNTKRLAVIAGLVMTLCLAAKAQNKYECAMVKWDGPDKVAIIYPDRVETVRVAKVAKMPDDVTEEEFCLTWGANKLGKEGWEPVNLNSRRILFRRALKN